MLANCNWERPLYMAISVGEVSKLKFDHYFVQEGLAFRFTPFDYKKWGNVKGDNNYAIDVERLYENVMNRYKYGGLDTPIWMKPPCEPAIIIEGFSPNWQRN